MTFRSASKPPSQSRFTIPSLRHSIRMIPKRVIQILHKLPMHLPKNTLHHRLLHRRLDCILTHPIMPNKPARTPLTALGRAIRLITRQGADPIGIIIAHEIGKRALLVVMVQAEVVAAVVAGLVGAFEPVLHDLVRLGVVLRDDEAAILVQPAVPVEVVAGVGVFGQRERDGRADVPVREQVFQRDLGLVEDDVAVGEDDEAV